MKLHRRRPDGGERAGSIFRVYMGGNALVSGYMSLCEPRSLVYLVASTTGGSLLIAFLALAGAAAIFDAVINDFMPARFHWRTALRLRHWILAVLAFGYGAQLHVAFFDLGSPALLVQYIWNVFVIMALAYFDAHQRSKDASCVMSCN